MKKLPIKKRKPKLENWCVISVRVSDINQRTWADSEEAAIKARQGATTR